MEFYFSYYAEKIMKYFQSAFVYFKILSFMIFLSSFTNIAFSSALADGSAKPKKEEARENEAINYLISTLKKLKLYSVRYPQFPSCVYFDTDEVTDEYIMIELREKHDGLACKGDTNVAPILDRYKVMNTKPMKVYLLDVDGKYSPILDGDQLTEIIKDIRNQFIVINKNIKSYRLIEKNVLGMSLEGGLLKAYIANGELKKATITLFGETGRESYDLYYNANDLIFVMNTSYRYNAPFGKVVSKDENRYYFQNGKMIKWINEKGNDALITEKEAVERESNMVDLSKLVINISKIQFNCVEVSSDTEYKKCDDENTKHQ